MRSEPAPLRLLAGLALGALAARLVLMAGADPFMDEAYYWLWGRHPALSYYDHPPLVGWSAWLSGTLFGWTLFALRLPVVLTLLGDLVLLWLFARRLAPGAPMTGFALSGVLLLSTPIFFAMTTLALPDHLLIVFSLLSLYGFYRFLEAPEPPRWRWLFVGAAALGLAGLAKYTAGLIGLGFALTLLLSPRFRPLLARPQLYLAALLALAMQAPVLAWNAQHGWASLRFLAGGRAGLPAGDLSGLVGYLLTILAFVGPFLLWPAGRFLLARRRPDDEAEAALLFRVVALLSTGAWLVASLFTNILFHWNLVAYVALLPLLGRWLGAGRLFGLHMAYGVLAIGLAVVNYTMLPVTALAGRADQTSAWSFGFDEVAAAVRQARAARPVDFVAATDYALAAPLAFALADPSVTSLDADTDQFDFWFDAAAHRGGSALIVSDGWRPLDAAIAARFAKLTGLGDVTITRFGREVNRYRLTLGEGFAALAGGAGERL